MKEEQTSSEATTEDTEARAATIAVALAAAAERMVPIAGTGSTQRSTHAEEAQAPTEAVSQVESALRAMLIKPTNWVVQ